MPIKRSIFRLSRFTILIALGIFLIVAGIFPSVIKAAEEFSYSINVTYNVPQTGPTNVQETYNITNNTSNKYLDSIKISTPSGDVENLKVYYTDGGAIPFTTEKITSSQAGFKYEYTQVNIDFTGAKVGYGLRWGFVVDYNTNSLVENKGRANIVYIPGIASQNRNNYNVNLIVPDTFGEVHGFGGMPKEVSRQAGRVAYSFNEDDLINNSLQLLFGNSTTYKADFIYPINNDSSVAKAYTITLPPSTASQSVYIQNIEPKPESTSLDADGNIIARYQIAAGQKLDVKVTFLAEVRYLKYDLSKSGTKSDIPRNLVNEYTKSTQYWQSGDSAIKAKAEELTKGKKTVAEQVQAINKYVIDTLEYNNEKIKYNIRQGALKAYANPANVVCLEYSDLSIALYRAAGIPARMPVGYGYSGNLKLSPSVSDSLHSWVEVYVPNVGWINLDPTWGEKFNNFGISDIDHLTFAIWGANDSLPAAIAENGRDINYQYERATLSYVMESPKVSKDATLQVQNYVILPFLSIIRYNGTSPTNAATYNMEIEIGEQGRVARKALGSTAPAQKFSGYSLIFGRNYASQSPAKLSEPSSKNPLALTTTTNNFTPLVVIILIVSVILALIVIKLRNKSKRKHHHEKTISTHDQR